MYYSLLLVTLALAAPPAQGQVDLTVDPAMTRGAVGARVTIVEFADYQ